MNRREYNRLSFFVIFIYQLTLYRGPVWGKTKVITISKLGGIVFWWAMKTGIDRKRGGGTITNKVLVIKFN